MARWSGCPSDSDDLYGSRRPARLGLDTPGPAKPATPGMLCSVGLHPELRLWPRQCPRAIQAMLHHPLFQPLFQPSPLVLRNYCFVLRNY